MYLSTSTESFSCPSYTLAFCPPFGVKAKRRVTYQVASYLLDSHSSSSDSWWNYEAIFWESLFSINHCSKLWTKLWTLGGAIVISCFIIAQEMCVLKRNPECHSLTDFPDGLFFKQMVRQARPAKKSTCEQWWAVWCLWDRGHSRP